MDPFAHHPELRDRITPIERSFFKDFSLAKVEALAREHNLPEGWWYDDETREAMRQDFLAAHLPEGDIWVFGYGSLIWDPAFDFVELRRAHAPQHVRRFILKEDKGGRGTADKPGLMAALDDGAGCDGVAFRIKAGAVDETTDRLWRREIICEGYLPRFIPVLIDGQPLEALTFVADHACDNTLGDLPHAQQVEWLATGAGMLGSSRAYLENLIRHLDLVGISDPALNRLLADVEAHGRAGTEPDA